MHALSTVVVAKSTPLEDAIALCHRHNLDFWHEAKARAANGWLIITPDCVAVVERVTPAAVFVWLAVGSGYLGHLCALAGPSVQFVQWARGIKSVDGRTETLQWSMQRVRALCRVFSETEHSESPRRPAPDTGCVAD